MTENHPITPPSELVKEWATANGTVYKDLSVFCQNIATQAARWGADQELEACCSWVSQFDYDEYNYRDSLYEARRSPKPPSLKAQALAVLDDVRAIDATHYNILRNALEALPE